MAEDGILRGSVDPFVHFTSATESKQSLGQFSDHIDKYRDVALWFMIFCWFWARSLHWSAKFGSNDRRWKSICPGIPFKIPLPCKSKKLLKQFLDHIDKYREVALWLKKLEMFTNVVLEVLNIKSWNAWICHWTALKTFTIAICKSKKITWSWIFVTRLLLLSKHIRGCVKTRQ